MDKDNHGKWKLFFVLELKEYGGADIFRGNLNKKDLRKYKMSDTFITEILQLWSEINFDGNIDPNEQFLSMNLWHNSLIAQSITKRGYPKEYEMLGI